MKNAPSPEANARYAIVDVDALKPHPLNPNRGDVDRIRTSIDQNGFFGVVIAQENTNYIIAGEHRWRAADAAGLLQVATLFLDVDDATAVAILLVDNESRKRGRYDDDALLGLLKEARSTDGTLKGTGYSDEDLAELLAKNAAAADPDDAPPRGEAELRRLQQKWSTAEGQIWAAGLQRLAIGSSTDPAVVDALLAADYAESDTDSPQVHAIWTDPPYGVSYTGGTGLTIENDDLPGDELGPFLEAAFRAVDPHLRPKAPIYIAHPAGPLSLVFAAVVDHVGWEVRQSVPWVKDRFVLGRSDYHFRHEPVIYACSGRGTQQDERPWYGLSGPEAPLSYFETPRPQTSELHPTMKPVALVAHHLRQSTKPGHIVFDGFSGSGTTIRACQDLGLRGRGIELSPLFAAGILEQLSDMGTEPRLIEGARAPAGGE